MSLSPLVSFKSRFVTYLLNFPRKNDLKFAQCLTTQPPVLFFFISMK